MLQFYNVTISYTNTAIANFTRPVLNVFDKIESCIASLNHIRCSVLKHATPE